MTDSPGDLATAAGGAPAEPAFSAAGWGALGPFRYLIVTEARNRLRRQARRLRSPRYALALLAGLVYFWFIFGGPRFFDGRPARSDSPLPEILHAVGPLLVALYAGMTWIFGKAEALAFRPAEVHLLFPGPLSRRDLLRYKLLHAQIPLLFTSTFLTLASSGAPLPWWLRFPSLWVLFATLQLHQMAAALVHESAAQQGLLGWRRNWLPILVFAAVAGVLALAINGAIADARSAADVPAALAVFQEALNTRAAAVVLAPFRWVIAPLLGGVAEWPLAALAAVAVLLLHYLWVLRTDTAFEESAAAAGERRARAAMALRAGGGWRSYARALNPETGKRRAPTPAAFRLAPTGAPEIALVWKNLTYTRRNLSRSTPVIVAATVFALLAMFRAGGATSAEALEHVGSIALGFGGVLVILAPLWARNDLRMDLLRIDVLRTLPVEPGRLVAAEITASAVTASLLALSVLSLGALLIALSGNLPLSPGLFALACLGGGLLVPALATLGVTVQCAIALLFPAWVHLGKQRPAGIEAMGQNILTLAAATILVAVLLLPAILVGGLAAAALAWQWGSVAPVFGALVGIAACYVEVGLAARALGHLFDRTDAVAAGITS